MPSLVEYAPATLAVIAAGILAGGIVVLFRTFGPRIKTRDLVSTREDPTRWVYVDGKKVPEIAPSQMVVYTGTARLNRGVARLGRKAPETVDAEIVESDERTRKLAAR